MSEFYSRLEWKRDHPDFELKTFNRSHRIHFPNGALLEGSSAPDYSGDPEKNNPAVSYTHLTLPTTYGV